MMSARDDYPKLDHETSGPRHQGGTSREAQQALDEIDRLRAERETYPHNRILSLRAEVAQLEAERASHDCADKFPTVKVPKGRIISIEFPEGENQEPILMIPVAPVTEARTDR